MKKILFILSTLFVFVIPVSASGEDQKYVISGTVLADENGSPLPGASVLIKDTYLGVTTDSRGQFSFKPLKEGVYVVEVSYLGYEKSRRVAELDSDLNLEFRLKIKLHVEIITKYI